MNALAIVLIAVADRGPGIAAADRARVFEKFVRLDPNMRSGVNGTGLSRLDSEALRLYLEGASYEEMAEQLGCDTKTIDNALQRVKRKILNHQRAREVLL